MRADSKSLPTCQPFTRRRCLGVAAFVCVAGCGDAYRAAFLLELTGSTATPGGGYRIELREANGGALKGTRATFVKHKPGKQDVALIIERDGFFGGEKSRPVRLYVEATADADGAATSLGSVLATLKPSKTTAVTLRLHADPRPIIASATAHYQRVADGNFRLIVVPGIVTDLSSVYAYHVWSTDAEGQHWLGAFSTSAASWSLRLNGSISPIERESLAVMVSAEPGGATDPLVRSNGWEVMQGSLDERIREPLENALEDGGWLDGMLALALHAADHAGFAASSFNRDSVSGAISHAEHVYNITSGAKGESSFDTNSEASYAGVTDRTGIETYRVDSEAAAVIATESGVDDGIDRLAISGDILACSGALETAVQEVRGAVTAFAADPTADTLDALVAAASRLSGAPYEVAPSDASEQTGLCMHERIEALAAFSLTTVD